VVVSISRITSLFIGTTEIPCILVTTRLKYNNYTTIQIHKRKKTAKLSVAIGYTCIQVMSAILTLALFSIFFFIGWNAYMSFHFGSGLYHLKNGSHIYVRLTCISLYQILIVRKKMLNWVLLSLLNIHK
jgi:hypothetical protein